MKKIYAKGKKKKECLECGKSFTPWMHKRILGEPVWVKFCHPECRKKNTRKRAWRYR